MYYKDCKTWEQLKSRVNFYNVLMWFFPPKRKCAICGLESEKKHCTTCQKYFDDIKELEILLTNSKAKKREMDFMTYQRLIGHLQDEINAVKNVLRFRKWASNKKQTVFLG